jgi:hypothetical protein
MSDNRGRGSDNDEGRIEKNSSRPYENWQSTDDKKKDGTSSVRENTQKQVNDILNKR